jgi:hypothetical protein
MPVLVNKSRRSVVLSARGVALAPGRKISVSGITKEIAGLLARGILARVGEVAPEPVVVPEPAPEPVVVPEPAPEPVVVPEPAPEPEVGAEPRRRGRPAKSEA